MVGVLGFVGLVVCLSGRVYTPDLHGRQKVYLYVGTWTYHAASFLNPLKFQTP
jgi:hypothetical protein